MRLWASLAFGALIAHAGAGAHAQSGNGAVRILLGFADEAGFSFAQLISDNIAAAMGNPS